MPVRGISFLEERRTNIQNDENADLVSRTGDRRGTGEKRISPSTLEENRVEREGGRVRGGGRGMGGRREEKEGWIRWETGEEEISISLTCEDVLPASYLRSYLLHAAMVQGTDRRVSGVELQATAIGGVAPNGGVNRARATCVPKLHAGLGRRVVGRAVVPRTGTRAEGHPGGGLENRVVLDHRGAMAQFHWRFFGSRLELVGCGEPSDLSNRRKAIVQIICLTSVPEHPHCYPSMGVHNVGT